MNTINRNLKEMRLKKGLTQQQLANELFVTRQCISRWEQGRTLPDVNNIEKISIVLGCSINDLIDDSSIKSITIKEAINSKKNKTIMWITFSISIVAVLGTMLSLYNNNKPQEDVIIQYDDYYGYVKEINYDLLTMTLEEYETQELVYLDFIDLFMSIKGNRDNTIKYDEIELNDKIHIKQESINNYALTKIDSLVEEELFGVYISNTGDEYQNLDEIKLNLDVMYIAISDGSSSSSMTQEYEYDYVLEELYRESIYDIYILVNPLVMQDEIEIGLITSNGIRINDTIEVNDLESIYTYEGEINLNSSDKDYIDNFNVTFNIHIHQKFSYSSLEVYEYDKNNNLINETTISDLNGLRDFKANIDALYCLLEINTIFSNGMNTWNNSEVYKMYLGESKELYQADDAGIVFKDWFIYRE